jgi:phosphate transport system substrate-binding protein
MARVRLIRVLWSASVALSAGLAGSPGAGAAARLSGTGSSLVAPLAAAWANAYNLAQSTYILSFTGTDSGTGLADTAAGITDFGGSDIPIRYQTATPYSAFSGGAEQIPWSLTATAVAYDLPGVSGLRLNAKVLAEIYTGRVKNWNSRAIQALNGKTRLPKLRITPIVRTGTSGDSFVFQWFLHAGAPSQWRFSPTATWPVSTTGLAEVGNAGVYNEVAHVNGAIGYIAAPYLASTQKGSIREASVQNAAGNFEYPTNASVTAATSALSAATIPAQGAGFALNLMYPPAGATFAGAYPIATFTYAIVPDVSNNTAALQGFIGWVLSPTGGQPFAAKLGYVPLPPAVLAYDLAALSQL